MHQEHRLWDDCCGFRIYRSFLVGLDDDGEIIAYYAGGRICLEDVTARSITCAH